MKKSPTKTYVKPKVEKQGKMVFSIRGLSRPGSPLSCRQCSSCHGCR